MYLLVEGYYRERGESVGKITGAFAVTELQLSGTILRLLRSGEANVTVVTEIEEAVFSEFYQERISARLKSEGSNGFQSKR